MTQINVDELCQIEASLSEDSLELMLPSLLSYVPRISHIIGNLKVRGQIYETDKEQLMILHFEKVQR